MNLAPLARHQFMLMGEEAVYLPPGGLPISCRVIRQGGGQTIMLGSVPVCVERSGYHVLRSDIPAPMAGATLTVAGATHVVDAVMPVDRDAQALKWDLRVSWGAFVAYRSVSGSGATQSPPQGGPFVVNGAAPAGAASLSLRATYAVGRLLAGDVLAVDGGEYTVTAGVTAASGRFSAVPISPVLAADVADGSAAEIVFVRDYMVKAATAGYEATTVMGGIQAGDKRLVILQSAFADAGMTEQPKPGDKITIGGAMLNVISAAPVYQGAAPAVWDIQARA